MREKIFFGKINVKTSKSSIYILHVKLSYAFYVLRFFHLHFQIMSLGKDPTTKRNKKICLLRFYVPDIFAAMKWLGHTLDYNSVLFE